MSVPRCCDDTQTVKRYILFWPSDDVTVAEVAFFEDGIPEAPLTFTKVIGKYDSLFDVRLYSDDEITEDEQMQRDEAYQESLAHAQDMIDALNAQDLIKLNERKA